MEHEQKFSHAEVGFEHPAEGKDHCSLCRHYLMRINRPRCEIVADPIHAGDWCRKFERDPNRHPEGASAHGTDR